MKRVGGRNQGYTIVETMIFLAVTGLLFVAAAIYINGQQSRTEFNQAIKEVESQIRDTANDVSTGYYGTRNNFDCSSGPTITSHANANNQGTNIDCTFIGRAIQFAPSGSDKGAFVVYNMVGNRQTGVPARDVASLAEAVPTAIAPGFASHLNVPDSSQINRIGGGVTVEWIRYNPAGPDVNISTLAFMNDFGSNVSKKDNNFQINLVAVNGTAIGDATTRTVDVLDSYFPGAPANAFNPNGGIRICLQKNGGNSQHAVMTIGGQTSRNSVVTDVLPGACS